MSVAAKPASDFFVAGGTLRSGAACYVTRQADTDLFQAVRRGEFCYVLTSRQRGKSSLMIRTTNRLRETGIAVAVLDLTAVGLNLTPEQWYNGLLSFVGQQLGIEDELDNYWFANSNVSPMRRFFNALKTVVLPQVPGPIVLFVDEVDVVRSLSFSADEFFAGIRECYTRRAEDPAMERLIFGLFGVAAPSDLIRDTRVTPFNIGTRIELCDFVFADARILANALGPQGDKQLERVFYWTAGHPYLTLKLCRALATDTTTSRAADVDRHVKALFLSAQAQEADDNLLFVRRWLLEGGADPATLLTLYRDVWQGQTVAADDTNALITVLRLSGIVQVKQGKLYLRNNIYQAAFDKNWIIAHMPGAELRRQKEAYQRGALRTFYFSGGAALVMGIMLFTTLSQMKRADKMADIAKREQKRAEAKAKEAAAKTQEAADLAKQIEGIRHSNTDDVHLKSQNEQKIKKLQARLVALAHSLPVNPPTPVLPAPVPTIKEPAEVMIRLSPEASPSPANVPPIKVASSEEKKAAPEAVAVPAIPAIPIPDDTERENFINQGRDFYRQEDFMSAAEAFEKAADLKTDVNTSNWLAKTYSKIGKNLVDPNSERAVSILEKSIKMYDKAIALMDDRPTQDLADMYFNKSIAQEDKYRATEQVSDLKNTLASLVRSIAISRRLRQRPKDIMEVRRHIEALRKQIAEQEKRSR